MPEQLRTELLQHAGAFDDRSRELRGMRSR
jgi:hypothetical protein